MNSPLIRVKNLNYYYRIKQHKLHAIKNISFDIYPGETLGLVGESGSGKTTIGKLLQNTLTPSSGSILFEDKPIRENRQKIQMVYQDPYSSLNPRMTVRELISEPLVILGLGTRDDQRRRVQELLGLVGLSTDFMGRYPHELSGGQRQRVAIARALAPSPKFLILDEPITALDVSIQAQIINLLKKLQGELGLTFLFISHDLSIVKYLSERVAVMYFGEIIELADSHKLYTSPLHPYTEALLGSIPIADPVLERARKKNLIEGELPSPFLEVEGCPFQSRCKKAFGLCLETPPTPKNAQDHLVSCHLYT